MKYNFSKYLRDKLWKKLRKRMRSECRSCKYIDDFVWAPIDLRTWNQVFVRVNREITINQKINL